MDAKFADRAKLITDQVLQKFDPNRNLNDLAILYEVTGYKSSGPADFDPDFWQNFIKDFDDPFENNQDRDDRENILPSINKDKDNDWFRQ